MPVAPDTENLNPMQEALMIVFKSDSAGQRVPETWPSVKPRSVRLVFRIACEDYIAAAGASILSLLPVPEQATREWALGAFLTQNTILLVAQCPLPVLLG